jgi:DNA-binding transcriptional ArsR family regulator
MQAAPDLPEVRDARKVAAARAGLPPPEVVADAVEVFKALASPIRLRIVHALAHEELSVGDLAHAFHLSLSATSHQLAVLRRLKLVAARELGRVTLYRAINDAVGSLVHDCFAHLGSEHRHPHAPPARRTRRRR